MRRPSGELPWTDEETRGLKSHADVIAELRSRVEQWTATPDEQERFTTAVFALDKAVKDKERPVGDVIVCVDKEGKEVLFDLAEIRRQWVQFYETHDLAGILKDDQGQDTLPADIRLTPEQVDLLKAKAKEGFTLMILFPAGVEGHLQSLKENLTDGLAQDASNNPIPTFLSYNVKPNFPNQIQTTDPRRLGKAYLLMTNPDAALHPGTKDKSADEIIRTFADPAVNVSGLTLADYLIEERRHFDETGQHLVDFSKNEWTWLLASRDAASRVLGADWNPNNRQVGVGSSSPGDRDPGLGARSSVVLALES